MTRYTLNLSEEQAAAVMRACELYARMHIGQLDCLTWALLRTSEGESSAQTVARHLEAQKALAHASEVLFNYERAIPRSEQGDAAFDVYQVMRAAMDETETRAYKPPFQMGKDPLPACTAQKGDDSA